jgi:integrase
MAHDLVLPDSLPPALPGALAVPATVADAGEAAARRYVEFFAAQIRNPNTRAAYARAASDFFGWCGRHGLALAAVAPVHVAAWVEGLGRDEGLSAPSVKQRLAAVRMLFDWLVVGQVVPHNPAAPVRGPKHSAAKGKTRMPTRDEAKALLAAIPTENLVGLRDRALIGTLLYTFARVGAATAMRVGDYYPVGKRWWVRLTSLPRTMMRPLVKLTSSRICSSPSQPAAVTAGVMNFEQMSLSLSCFLSIATRRGAAGRGSS